jgi:hypothetical protein
MILTLISRLLWSLVAGALVGTLHALSQHNVAGAWVILAGGGVIAVAALVVDIARSVQEHGVIGSLRVFVAWVGNAFWFGGAR